MRGSRKPTVSELPRPPGGSGWPWTPAATEADRPRASNHQRLPRITLVVPSFNQGEDIERCLRSIILQGYADLQLLVIDGGSTDRTVEVLRTYAPWIDFWSSRSDRGQSHALNQGFARATGMVFGWLCCDDVLAPGALDRVGACFTEADVDVVVGRCVRRDVGSADESIVGASAETLALMPHLNPVPQSSCFFRRPAMRVDRLLRERFHYSMDSELWNRLREAGARWRCVDDVLSIAYTSGTNKTSRGGTAIIRELVQQQVRYAREPIPLVLWYLLLRWPLDWIIIHADEPLFARMLRPLQVLYTAALAPFYGTARIKAMNAWSGFAALSRATRALRRLDRGSG